MNNYYIYYLEIRNRVFLLVLSWISVSIICYFYKEILIFEIIDTTNYVGFSKSNPYFTFSDVTDIFSVSIQLILFVANQICFVFIVYHLLMFFSAGLYIFELKNIFLLLKISFIYWVFFITIFHYIIFPGCWVFFLSFQDKITDLNSVSLFFEANFKKYFDYYINFYYLCVINFQLSCLIPFSITAFTHKVEKIKIFRKKFYLLFVIISTLMTPPDIFSQLFLSLCLIFIYEFLFFLKIFNKVAN